jgi:hypothetical protein
MSAEWLAQSASDVVEDETTKILAARILVAKILAEFCGDALAATRRANWPSWSAAQSTIEIYVMPELIGSGKPRFPPTGFQASPKLLSAQASERGCVRLHYALSAAGRCRAQLAERLPTTQP